MLVIVFSPLLYDICRLVPCEVRKQKSKGKEKVMSWKRRPCAFLTSLHAKSYTLVLIMRRLKINMATEYFYESFQI